MSSIHTNLQKMSRLYHELWKSKVKFYNDVFGWCLYPQCPVQPRKKEKKRKKYDEDDPNYDTWVPPSEQSGDGRTSLNDKLGYWLVPWQLCSFLLGEERGGDVNVGEDALRGRPGALGPDLLHDICHSLPHVQPTKVTTQQQEGC